MERIVYVDDNDTIIGHGTRQDAMQRGIRRRVVEVFVVNLNGELLIQKRSATVPTDPLKWDVSTAGHVDEGEEYLEAATRELGEELGITGIPLTELKKIQTEGPMVGGGMSKRSAMLYIANYDGEVPFDSKEVAEVKWMRPEDIKEWMEKQPDDFSYPFFFSFKEFLSSRA